MALPNRPQQQRLKYPLTAHQVEALDNMLEQLFRAQRRTTSLVLNEGTLAGRGSASDAGVAEEITLGTNLSIVGQELQVNLTGVDSLAEMVDVLFASLANGDIIVYNSATSKWNNMTVAAFLLANNIFRYDVVTTGDPDPEVVFVDGEVLYTLETW